MHLLNLISAKQAHLMTNEQNWLYTLFAFFFIADFII